MSGLAHVSAAATLDRGALLTLADGYFAAMLANDPRKVPLADDFKVVENVKRLTSGDGRWKTTKSAPTAFKISDMSNQRAFDMPALHIFKIWGGPIHEIEAVGVTVPYNSPTGWE